MIAEIDQFVSVCRTMKSSMYGSCGFAAVSSAMLAQKYRSFGPTREHVDDAVMDRAFRLKFHQSQTRLVDFLGNV